MKKESNDNSIRIKKIRKIQILITLMLFLYGLYFLYTLISNSNNNISSIVNKIVFAFLIILNVKVIFIAKKMMSKR